MINSQEFIAWIGNGENERGTFPANLTELNDDICEFEDKTNLKNNYVIHNTLTQDEIDAAISFDKQTRNKR